MSVSERQYAINWTMWNMNGGPISLDAQTEIDLAIEKAIKQVEKKEAVRLLYQRTLG